MNRKYLLILTTIIFYLLGCAGQPALEEDLVWPLPPDKPRIKLVDVYSDNNSVGQSNFQNFINNITGEGRIKLSKPFDVSVDSDERVYVSDTGVASVVVFGKPNNKIYKIGNKGRAKLQLPLGLVVVQDKLFVTDGSLNKIYGYSLDGKLLISIGRQGELGTPAYIAYSETNNLLYVSDSKENYIRVYDATSGQFKFEFGGPGELDGNFNRPAGIAIENDKVYIVDQMNFRVQIFDLDGNFIKKFGEVGGGVGYIFRPKGIDVTKDGFIFLADAEFQNFQIFDEDGNVYLYVGQLGNEPGEFRLPAGLFIDDSNHIYVVDQLNKRVQKFKFLGGD